MITAEEFLKNNEEYYMEIEESPEIFEMMIEFAKIHVQEALKQASEKAQAYNKPKFSSDINPQVDMESILNAYPLENII
jgi:hypothetical protein